LKRLENKVAMVTGGTSGIGEATARLFAQEGAKVVVCGRNGEKGKRLVEEISKSGGTAIFQHLDVTLEQDWQAAIKETLKAFGKLNILVNSAGLSLTKNIEETTLEDWNTIMSVNATGVFLGTKHAINAMKDNGELCSIINISSIDGVIGDPGLFAYCASKGAVRLLTKSAALHCGKKGYKIRINSVHPATVVSNMTREEARGFGMEPEEFFRSRRAFHPIGFVGEPLDVAYMNLYLASDESRWVTGAEFLIDGGYTAQ